MKKIHLGILFLFSFVLLFNSCGTDSDDVPGGSGSSQTLKIELVGGEKYNYRGGEFFLRIITNGSWKIDKPASDNWYSFSSTSGQGNQTVVLKLAENGNASRTSKFTVSVGKTVHSIEITQDKFEEELLYYPRQEAYRIEIPKLSEDFVDNKAKFVVHYAPDTYGNTHLNFSLEYNIDSRHSRWVAFTFYDKTAESHTQRTNAWSLDPYLIEYTNNENDYSRSGYDRGHIMASADRLFSKTANEQTFYYSNITPQKREFNAGIWLELENTLRNYWGRSNTFRDTLYVVKGGTIRDDQITGTIGQNNIVVPKYNYMAILAKKADTYRSIAFWFENRKYEEPYRLKEHAMSVAELEELTGIDFFHNLPDEIESVVEKQRNFNWPGL